MSNTFKPVVNYAKLGTDMWSTLLTLKLSHSEYRVLHYITAHLKPGGCMVDVQQKDIATYFDMDKATVSKVYTSLSDKDVMRKIHRGSWMLNPTVFYKAGNQYYDYFVQEYYGGKVKPHPEISELYKEIKQEVEC